MTPDPDQIQTSDLLAALLHVPDPVERLRRVRHLEAEVGEFAGSLRSLKGETIRALRDDDHGFTWAEIGDLLGVSAQRAEALSRPKD